MKAKKKALYVLAGALIAGSLAACKPVDNEPVSSSEQPGTSVPSSSSVDTRAANAITMSDTYACKCKAGLSKADLDAIEALGGDVVVKYYSDAACTVEVTVADLVEGTYYVKATTEGDDEYLPAEKVATLTVTHDFSWDVSDPIGTSTKTNCPCGAAATGEETSRLTQTGDIDFTKKLFGAHSYHWVNGGMTTFDNSVEPNNDHFEGGLLYNFDNGYSSYVGVLPRIDYRKYAKVTFHVQSNAWYCFGVNWSWNDNFKGNGKLYDYVITNEGSDLLVEVVEAGTVIQTAMLSTKGSVTGEDANNTVAKIIKGEAGVPFFYAVSEKAASMPNTVYVSKPEFEGNYYKGEDVQGATTNIPNGTVTVEGNKLTYKGTGYGDFAEVKLPKVKYGDFGKVEFTIGTNTDAGMYVPLIAKDNKVYGNNRYDFPSLKKADKFALTIKNKGENKLAVSLADASEEHVQEKVIDSADIYAGNDGISLWFRLAEGYAIVSAPKFTAIDPLNGAHCEGVGECKLLDDGSIFYDVKAQYGEYKECFLPLVEYSAHPITKFVMVNKNLHSTAEKADYGAYHPCLNKTGDFGNYWNDPKTQKVEETLELTCTYTEGSLTMVLKNITNDDHLQFTKVVEDTQILAGEKSASFFIRQSEADSGVAVFPATFPQPATTAADVEAAAAKFTGDGTNAYESDAIKEAKTLLDQLDATEAGKLGAGVADKINGAYTTFNATYEQLTNWAVGDLAAGDYASKQKITEIGSDDTYGRTAKIKVTEEALDGGKACASFRITGNNLNGKKIIFGLKNSTPMTSTPRINFNYWSMKAINETATWNAYEVDLDTNYADGLWLKLSAFVDAGSANAMVNTEWEISNVYIVK